MSVKESTQSINTETQAIIKSATKGNTDDQVKLGTMYLEGSGGMAKSEEKAVEWYRTAANKGNPFGQLRLAYMYEEGSANLPKDAKKVDSLFKDAFKGFETRAKTGDTSSQYLLGFLYVEGRGTKKDRKKGAEWLEKAAKKDDLSAQVVLANLLLKDHKDLKKNEREAVKWLTKAAEQDHADSQFTLAKIYLEGTDDVCKNEKKAIEFLEKSAKNEIADAQFTLGRIYLGGTYGVDKNEKKAIELFTQSAQNQNSDALFALGNMYFIGKIVTQDRAKAIEYWQIAAALGHQKAIEQIKSIEKAINNSIDETTQLAAMYYEGTEETPKDLAKAAELFKIAADEGSTDACIMLAGMIRNGEGGLQKDEKLAMEYFRKSAEKGNVLGQLYYATGLHAQKKDALAFEWFKKAAENGNPEAMSKLAGYYAIGISNVIQKNPTEAKKWYDKAMQDLEYKKIYEFTIVSGAQEKANQGDPEAQLILGTFYLEGKGSIKKDEREAAKWFKEAANQGNAKAYTKLGIMHLYGKGGYNADGNDAIKWFETAAKKSDTEAMYFLAESYFKGTAGIKKDEQKAFEWHLKAFAVDGFKDPDLDIMLLTLAQNNARIGNAEAQRILGIMYLEGKAGLKKDQKIAMEWLNKSAKQGNSQAKSVLQDLHKKK